MRSQRLLNLNFYFFMTVMVSRIEVKNQRNIMEKIIEIPMFVVLWFSLIIDNCIGGSLPQHYIQAPDIYFEKLSWITRDKIL